MKLPFWDFVSQKLATYVEYHILKFQCDERSSACNYVKEKEMSVS